MKTVMMLVVALLVLVAPSAVLAVGGGTQTDCSVNYDVCMANCNSSAFDCYLNNPPSTHPFCRGLHAFCQENCFDTYQTCRWQEPYLTEEDDGSENEH